MIVSNQTKEEKHNYKIINIGKMFNNSDRPYIQPILEMKNYNKYNQSEYTQESEELYIQVKKTQDYINILMYKSEITIDEFSHELLMSIERENLNIDEIYTVISSHSFWEILENLMKYKPLKKIYKNEHQFNTLHKSLMPTWFPNQRNQNQELPKNLFRTSNDLMKTINFLIMNNLVESVLDPTPKVLKNGTYETSLVILTQNIPRYLIRTNYGNLYNIMFNIPTIDRFVLEFETLINLIEKNNNQYGNEIKWLFLQPYECIFQLIKKIKYDVRKVIQTLQIPIHQDYIFDEFFEKHPWTSEFCNLCISKLENHD